MYAQVLNPTNDRSTPIYSEWSGPDSDYKGPSYPYYNYLTPHKDQDLNSIIFHNFFQEISSDGVGYQKPDIFLSQLTQASTDHVDKDFQFVTFNVNEQNSFGALMPELGFELIGDSPGNHGTPIYFWVKTKKTKKK